MSQPAPNGRDRNRTRGRVGNRTFTDARVRERSAQRRGQTAILGIVLLIGVVAISSLGILLVAGETTSQIQEQSERERVEGAFVELSQVMASSSNNDDISQSMDLAAGQQGAVAKKETGWISVEANDSELINETIGTIEYEGDDGTRIAYQAGGVWRETGNQTQMVSAPPIHYDPTTETFSFPIVTVGGEKTLGSGDVSIAHEKTRTFPNASVVEDSSVTITIKSEYYRGWQGYFERQAGAPVIQDVDHANRTVTVRLGHLDIDGAFDSGLVYSDGYAGQGFKTEKLDPQPKPGSLPEIDRVIDEMIADIQAGDYAEDVEMYGTIDGMGEQETFENGTYYAEEIDLKNDVTFDLSNGNATLVVNGSMIADDGGLTVEEWENEDGSNHTLKIYTAENFYSHQQQFSVHSTDGSDNARQLQVYGTSQTSIGLHGGSFEGILYAPSSDFGGPNEVINEGNCGDHQVCLQSNPVFTGSIIASSVHFQANAAEVNYDESLKDADISIHPEEYILPPQLTYLNIFHHEVDVENA